MSRSIAYDSIVGLARDTDGAPYGELVVGGYPVGKAELLEGDTIARSDRGEGIPLLDAVRLKLLFVGLSTLLWLGDSVSDSEGARGAIGSLDEGKDIVARDTCLEVEEIGGINGHAHEARR